MPTSTYILAHIKTHPCPHAQTSQSHIHTHRYTTSRESKAPIFNTHFPTPHSHISIPYIHTHTCPTFTHIPSLHPCTLFTHITTSYDSSTSLHQTVFFHSSTHIFPTSLNVERSSREKGYAS